MKNFNNHRIITDFLFSTPSEEIADSIAIGSDFSMIGQDISDAINRIASKQKSI